MRGNLTAREIEVGDSAIVGFFFGVTIAGLLLGATWLYAEVSGDLADYVAPLIVFFAGLFACMGVGLTLVARNPDARRIWTGFVIGLLVPGALMVWMVYL